MGQHRYFSPQWGQVGCLELMIAAGADVCAQDNTGRSPTYMAGENNQVRCLELLIAAKADVHAVATDGSSSTLVAAQGGHADCLKLLVGAKADVCAVTNDGRSPTYAAALNSHTSCMELLIAAKADVCAVTNDGRSPTYAAAMSSHAGCMELLIAAKADLERPDSEARAPALVAATNNQARCLELLIKGGASIEQPDRSGQTPLLASAFNKANASALVLLDARADPNRRNDKGETALVFARRSVNAELLAALITSNADATVVFSPLVALCMRGDAHAARQLLLGRKPQAQKSRAQLSGGNDMPPLVEACLIGDAKLVAAQDRTCALRSHDNGLPSPFYFATELGDLDVQLVLLDGVEGFDAVQRATVTRHTSAVVAAHRINQSEGNAKTPGYIAGSRYQALLLALISEGLIDVAMCKAVKNMVAERLPSVALAAHFVAAPLAFVELKAAMESRLKIIAEPLDRIYNREQLGKVLKGLGAGVLGLTVAADDPGLLPLPPYISAKTKEGPAYEPYLMRYIVMASIALDALFTHKLREALEPLGDKTEADDKEVRIYKDEQLIITIMFAPIKTLARMQNKLESAEDHRDKPVPRPKWNVDTVRKGVVVNQATLIEAAYEAINAKVGKFLRGKNLFQTDYDAAQSYGYRNFLGNLQLVSGLTVRSVFGGVNRAKWTALGRSWEAAGDGNATHQTEAVLEALLGEGDQWYKKFNMQIGDMPLNIAAEVQLIYLPYLHEGRAISHLPYKVVRCNCSSELARDTSGKQAEGLESVGDHQHYCGEIVVAQLVQRACVLSKATEVAATWANVKPVRFLEASFAQRKLEATRASFNSMQPFSSLRTPDDYAKGVLVRKQETKAVMLQWQARAISRSLTNLDAAMSKRACLLHGWVLEYCEGSEEDQTGPVHRLLSEGLNSPVLRDEIYAQLMKQLTKNPGANSIAKGWQILIMCLSTFPPSKEFEAYLINFLLRNSDKRGAVQAYAKVSLDFLSSNVGGRTAVAVPSLENIRSYKQRPPILATIHHVNGQMLISELSVAPSVNVGDVVQMCIHLVGLVDERRNTFGLFVLDDGPNVDEHGANVKDTRPAFESKLGQPPQTRPLRSGDFIGDVIVQFARKKRNIKFVFKRKIFLQNESSEDVMFTRLAYLQAEAEVISAPHCQLGFLDEADVIELAATELAITRGVAFPRSPEAAFFHDQPTVMEFFPPSCSILHIQDLASKILSYRSSLGLGGVVDDALISGSGATPQHVNELPPHLNAPDLDARRLPQVWRRGLSRRSAGIRFTARISSTLKGKRTVCSLTCPIYQKRSQSVSARRAYTFSTLKLSCVTVPQRIALSSPTVTRTSTGGVAVLLSSV